jgi:hypothetical protein
MAVNNPSGSRRTVQHSPEASASATPQPSKHVRIFEATANLNRGFDLVLHEVEQLKALGQFRGEFPGQFAKSCRLALEELRAWAIFELTEDLHERAQDDWARYGRLRIRWEDKFRDPNDVLAEAERLKKKLADEAAKKKAGNKNPKRKVRESAE